MQSVVSGDAKNSAGGSATKYLRLLYTYYLNTTTYILRISHAAALIKDYKIERLI